MSTLTQINSDDFKPSKIDTTDILKDMLTENTGRHMLDSGGAYGRNFEENQGKDFENEPVDSHDIRERDNGEIEIISTVSTYHFLKHRLDFDNECRQLNKQFYDRVNSDELEDQSWLSCMNACFGDCTVNTYNMEFHNTDQILQFAAFTLKPVCSVEEREPRPEDKEFVIGDMIHRAQPDIHGDHVALQIHGGCDVRGGYTAPVIFKAEADSLMMESTAELNCEECGNIGRKYETIHEFDEEQVKVVEEHEITGETELVHKPCGSIIELNCAVGY